MEMPVEPVFLVTGITILVVAFMDLLWTALWVSGSAGPVTSRLSNGAWRLALRVARGRHRALSFFGPGSLVGAIAAWSALLWAGWILVFASDPGSVRDAATGLPGGWTERAYFTGYALFTMGNGDMVPGPGWRIPTVLMNASGIILITLLVSYLVSVVSAVVNLRAFAASVTSLGTSPQAVLAAGWNGRDLRDLDSSFSNYAVALERLAEAHVAYPVLRYYHSTDASKAGPVAVAVLDDALTIASAIPEGRRPNRVALRSLRGAIDRYLGSVGEPRQLLAAPPAPGLDEIHRAEVPVDTRHLDHQLGELSRRRARLAAVVHEYGWTWPPG
jgi:hypothetical protein